ncbi:hypothetical protein EYC84_001787 [Monilinia fructicola]|uniref:Uncharacterized protein n=1 Tax=Monilinia fructicola TaxID=38448 RepID=A0A5M9JVK9_MONFR|nr:hypothetical protein EYC84_001787 [Monilinia fructicola]
MLMPNQNGTGEVDFSDLNGLTNYRYLNVKNAICSESRGFPLSIHGSSMHQHRVHSISHPIPLLHNILPTPGIR